jgi:hypothetical protein
MGNKFAQGSEGGARKLIPPRTYLGAVIGVYDIGIQPGFKGGAPENKFVIEWELHYRGSRRRDPEPARNEKGEILKICKFVGLRLGTRAMPSDLLKIIEAIEGENRSAEWIKETKYDVEQLVEGFAQLAIITKGEGEKARSIIDGFMALEPDEDEPKIERDSYYFELTEAIVKAGALPCWLPKFVADYIQKSAEWVAVHGTNKPDNGERRRVQPAERAAAPSSPPGVVGASAGGAGGAPDDDDDDDDDLPF